MAITLNVALPLKPAKSNPGVAPLSFTATYQNDRNRTMNVFAFPLTRPRIVAEAAMKSVPPRNASIVFGDPDIRRSGAIANGASTKSDDRSLKATKRGLSNGDANVRAMAPARASRQATSAMAMPMTAMTTGIEDFNGALNAM